ncbi:farnesyl-diphosphate synthase [Defluviimonas sp. 20V17]|uniref:Geranylgeranyl diphosphate synthase n=1 Tax=Allgaiera indica TaxID=765699 RepID=A0AAN4URB4_9RHOB|nr:farnesyl diphosphate synthase [Allgaiera indica]KDB02575.1 farnesyl-diphosphate synthase [Defluviimonas sp. 20V17]GHE01619.1 farnesyl-diphosphate synthase [Allgaiera indica]SDW97921.1 farnesyl-diphosphate synthase [Allgaiera indica]
MFPDVLAADAALIQSFLDAELADRADQPVIHAMRYALQGGKRLRGFLVMEGARLHGLAPEVSVIAAAAIEAMHAYSLIHDDLPCMDDDDLRRGQPTVHVKWDEATAVLAGDALQTLAFELLSREALGPAERRVALLGSMARAAGAGGMVLGQALDIAAETAAVPLTLDQITELQAGKTGALIRWSAEAGAHLAGADPSALGRYATALGLAFQIADDILDVEGDAEKAGKRLQKDAHAGKATFVSILGLEGARARARALVEQAEAALAGYGDGAERLRQAARFVIARDS